MRKYCGDLAMISIKTRMLSSLHVVFAGTFSPDANRRDFTIDIIIHRVLIALVVLKMRGVRYASGPSIVGDPKHLPSAVTRVGCGLHVRAHKQPGDRERTVFFWCLCQGDQGEEHAFQGG